jgi:type IV pilus assembly protein PilW
MLNIKPSQRGFTIIELMIALAINMVIFIALGTIFIANLNHYKRSLNSMRLNQQLQAAMAFMVNDIRRAGYWANANTDIGIDANDNPFQASGTDVSVNGSNNCILFTYDHDSDGSLHANSSSTDDERYGFRLQNSAIQVRPWGATFSCTASANAWENLTDPNIINITALSFTLNTSTVTTGPSARGLTMRSVDISITGQLVSDSSVSKTITQHVRIRNDKFIP